MINLQDELIIHTKGQGMYEITNTINNWITKKKINKGQLNLFLNPKYAQTGKRKYFNHIHTMENGKGTVRCVYYRVLFLYLILICSCIVFI